MGKKQKKKNPEMKSIRKPEYYDGFVCIADKCDFTCCQEWKIAVDDETNSRWKEVDTPKSIDHSEAMRSLSKYVGEKDGQRVIQLNNQACCPFLNEKKLCKLVLDYGDQILSNTCATFPRQTNEIGDWVEHSLVACCPAVVDVWKSIEKVKFNEESILQEIEREKPKNTIDWLIEIRTLFIEILQRTDFSVEYSLDLIFYLLLEIKEDKKELSNFSKYKDLTYQKEIIQAMEKMDFHSLDTFEERNELFLDMIENYKKEGLYKRYLDDIEKQAAAWSEFYDESEILGFLKEERNALKEYEHLFRNYLVAEIFTNTLTADSTLTDLIVSIQWIGIEYALLQHALLCKCFCNKDKKLSYQNIRDLLVLIARITGYDAKDIKEYLQNSFEELVWDWGYFALLIGNGK